MSQYTRLCGQTLRSLTSSPRMWSSWSESRLMCLSSRMCMSARWDPDVRSLFADVPPGRRLLRCLTKEWRQEVWRGGESKGSAPGSCSVTPPAPLPPPWERSEREQLPGPGAGCQAQTEIRRDGRKTGGDHIYFHQHLYLIACSCLVPLFDQQQSRLRENLVEHWRAQRSSTSGRIRVHFRIRMRRPAAKASAGLQGDTSLVFSAIHWLQRQVPPRLSGCRNPAPL